MAARRGLAHTFGWMRRTDLENAENVQVWEAPDGKLYASNRGEPVLEKFGRLPVLLARSW
jgi:hypothetical protein